MESVPQEPKEEVVWTHFSVDSLCFVISDGKITDYKLDNFHKQWLILRAADHSHYLTPFLLEQIFTPLENELLVFFLEATRKQEEKKPESVPALVTAEAVA